MACCARGIILPAIITAAGCNTLIFYQGDRLPSSQVAVVSPKNTSIDAIDGTDLGKSAFARYELLPGVHLISLAFKKIESGAIAIRTRFSLGAIPVCFNALAGRRYVATGRTNSNESKWVPEILEEETSRPVFIWPAAADGNCRREQRSPPKPGIHRWVVMAAH
jgi:hypothetical protein